MCLRKHFVEKKMEEPLSYPLTGTGCKFQIWPRLAVISARRHSVMEVEEKEDYDVAVFDARAGGG